MSGKQAQLWWIQINQCQHPPPQAREQTLEQTISSIIKRFGDGAIIKMGEASHLNVSVIPAGSLRV